MRGEEEGGEGRGRDRICPGWLTHSLLTSLTHKHTHSLFPLSTHKHVQTHKHNQEHTPFPAKRSCAPAHLRGGPCRQSGPLRALSEHTHRCTHAHSQAHRGVDV